MTEKNISPIRRHYSKSSAFYIDSKSDLFSTNDSLLSQAENQNALYGQQPIRTLCKICNQKLAQESDFVSHHVKYVFCANCGHLNGMHMDTESFAENLYIKADGASYASDYLDHDFIARADQIYAPKVEFLCSNLPAGTRPHLLDIGCGAGYLVYAALNQGLVAKGIDVNQTMIDFGNRQISQLTEQTSLLLCAESSFPDAIANTDAMVISAIGVIEHLRDPLAFFDAFHRSSAQFLFYSVPMFSFSVMLESVFTKVFPRQLSGGHTHLFTEQSVDWLHQNHQLAALAEWRFGTDIMDLYRSMNVELRRQGVSSKMLSFLYDGLGKNVDHLQAVFDTKHFCSEIHCLVTKR